MNEQRRSKTHGTRHDSTQDCSGPEIESAGETRGRRQWQGQGAFRSCTCPLTPWHLPSGFHGTQKSEWTRNERQEQSRGAQEMHLPCTCPANPTSVGSMKETSLQSRCKSMQAATCNLNPCLCPMFWKALTSGSSGGNPFSTSPRLTAPDLVREPDEGTCMSAAVASSSRSRSLLCWRLAQRAAATRHERQNAINFCHGPPAWKRNSHLTVRHKRSPNLSAYGYLRNVPILWPSGIGAEPWYQQREPQNAIGKENIRK